MAKLDELINMVQDDMKNRPNMFEGFMLYILQYTGTNFATSTESYTEMFYELQWPSEKTKAALAQAKFDSDNPVGILVSGVVIDNEVIDEGSNRRCLHIIHKSDFQSSKVTDINAILSLRKNLSSLYSIDGYLLREDFTYSIGSTKDIRPGTEVMMSLVNLEIDSDDNKTLKALCTDITEYSDDDDDELAVFFFIDSNFRVHGTMEYLTKYEQLRDEFFSKYRKSSNESNSGCYIATAVYGSNRSIWLI